MEYLRTPRIPENLRFVSVESIEQMRHEQEAAVIEAGADAVSGLSVGEVLEHGLDLRDQAQNELKQRIDESADLYVANYLNREDNEELFDGCVDLVRRYSVLNMSDSEWRAGERSATGEYDQPETAGQYRLYEELSALAVEEAPEPDEPGPEDDPVDPPEELSPVHSPAEVAALQNALETSRQTLAELSIQRRRLVMSNSKKGKRLAVQYNAAETAYNQAKLELGQLSVEALQASGMTDAEIKTHVITGIATEQAAFTQAEVDYMQSDSTKFGRFIRWYANKKTRMAGVNAGVGFVSGFGINKAAQIGLLAALPGVGFGALAGARAGKALISAKWTNAAHLHTDFENRRNQDAQTTQTRATEAVGNITGDGNADQYSQIFAQTSSEIAAERVAADIRGNKKRVAVAASIAGGAAALGAVLAHSSLLPRFGSANNSESIRPQTPTDSVDPALRAKIMANKEAFYRMINHPDEFNRYTATVEKIHRETGLTGKALSDRANATLALASRIKFNSGLNLNVVPGVDHQPLR